MHGLSKKEWLLLVLFLGLFVFPLQYLCRSLDMSTLTSWRWVFAGQGPGVTFILLAAAFLLVLPFSRAELPEKYPAAGLFILSLCFSLPFANTPEVLLDASRYFLQAKHLARYGVLDFFRAWGGAITPWTDLPLVPLLYGSLFAVFAEDKLVIALFNALLFSLVPVLTYNCGRLLWDRTTGFISGILVLASPYLLVQVPLMLVDIHTMFFLLLAVTVFIHALAHGGITRYTASAAAIVLALLSKYSTWPMLGVLPVIVFVSKDPRPLTAIKRGLAVLVALGCLLVPILFWQGDLIIQQLNFLRTYQMAGLQRWQEGYAAALFFQTHPFIVLLALSGIYRALVHRDQKMLIMAWFIALVFFLELRRVRYLLPLLPFLALTAGYGLRQIVYARVRRYIAYSLAFSSLVLALWVYKPFLASTSMVNLKDAGEYLNTLSAGAVEVYSLPQHNSLGNTSAAVPILDLFTRKKIYQTQPWHTAAENRQAENSSLRFTWEINQPSYYRENNFPARLPLVLISSRPVADLPPFLAEKYPGAKLRRRFTRTTGIFRYQTFVSIFDPP